MPGSKSLLCNNVTTVFYLEDFYTTTDNKLTNHISWNDFLHLQYGKGKAVP